MFTTSVLVDLEVKNIHINISVLSGAFVLDQKIKLKSQPLSDFLYKKKTLILQVKS